LPKRKSSRNDIYAVYGSSVPQRIFLSAVLAICVAGIWWLLFGGGISLIGSCIGRAWVPANDTRRLGVAIALSIYFVRLLFTQFFFLKRAMGWGEAGMIAPWLACIYLAFALAAGTNLALPGVAYAVGAILFVLGSWLNSYAEYARSKWKQIPENRGRLYTLGLFRYSRHPNYLGDLISFSGLCMISGCWLTVPIPLLMLAGFVFANIPMLDAHLRDHYGVAFDEYSARTYKLIPFIY
jgi:protein-S-isoprenylcysteine O-methyltransferase Ste14